MDRITKILTFFFTFVIIIDPTNTILQLKGILFSLLIFICVVFKPKRINIQMIKWILMTYIIFLSTLLFGYIQGFEIDTDFSSGIAKSFIPLFLLLWIDQLDFYYQFKIPSFIMAIILLVGYIIMLVDPELEFALYLFSSMHDDFIMMSRRTFLGIEVISLYYKSITLLFFPAGLYAYKFFLEKQKKKQNLTLMILFLFAIFAGGNRATILSVLLIFIAMLFYKINKIKYGNVILPLLIFTVVTSFSVLLYFLITEKGVDASNDVKSLHLVSYVSLFNDHPLILLFGQGAGSLFFTLGFGKAVPQTEWTYIEFIRMFGFIGGGLILFLFIYPIYIVLKKRTKLEYWYPFIVSYTIYILVAGTNPLLLGSTGMLALLTGYSFAFNQKKNINEKYSNFTSHFQ